MQRWASASADFARRHNPVNPIVHSRTVTRLKGWRPFNREGQQASYKDEATSTKGDGDNDSGLSQLEGGMGQLVHYLMPQVFIVAIFRKAQQVHAICFCTCKCMLPIPDPTLAQSHFTTRHSQCMSVCTCEVLQRVCAQAHQSLQRKQWCSRMSCFCHKLAVLSLMRSDS